MSKAAVPNYIGVHFDDCPPGHRFNLYFPLWNDKWEIDKTAKGTAIRDVLKLPPDAESLLEHVITRQRATAGGYAEGDRLVIEARATAPFATGLGNEHPIENGFAFLSPYGLPYLAGSGVKGVLRRAAEELRDEGDHEVRRAIEPLFGHEDAETPRRGVLTCWDVFPRCKSMTVEIMTPHYTDYYQDGKTPHDAGQPNPITFMAVPTESSFMFVLTCDTRRLLEDLRAGWKEILEKIFTHAFDWLGFGAKTAVGYGAMTRLSAEEIAKSEHESLKAALKCAWVDEKINELAAKNRANESDTLRGRGLAEAWAALADAELKARALADIRARWEAKGWWATPPGGAAKKAKGIYEGNP